jgi:hypothetical protein
MQCADCNISFVPRWPHEKFCKNCLKKICKCGCGFYNALSCLISKDMDKDKIVRFARLSHKKK